MPEIGPDVARLVEFGDLSGLRDYLKRKTVRQLHDELFARRMLAKGQIRFENARNTMTDRLGLAHRTE